MPNQITFAANINPIAATMEVTINAGTTWTTVAFTTVGSVQQYVMTGVTAATYAAGQLGLGAVAYPATRLYNLASVVVSAAAPTVSNATFTAA